MKKIIALVVGSLLILGVTGAAGYYYGLSRIEVAETPEMEAEPSPTSQAETEEGTICTMEAMECPDGSYVGRSGPNCEFAACPGEAGEAMMEAESELTVEEPAVY